MFYHGWIRASDCVCRGVWSWPEWIFGFTVRHIIQISIEPIADIQKDKVSSLCRWVEEGVWMRSNDDIEVRNCFRNLDIARISRVSDCDYRFHTLVVKFIMDIGWGCQGKYLPLPLAQQPPFAMILFRPWKWPDNINLEKRPSLARMFSTFPELEMNLVCGVMYPTRPIVCPLISFTRDLT